MVECLNRGLAASSVAGGSHTDLRRGSLPPAGPTPLCDTSAIPRSPRWRPSSSTVMTAGRTVSAGLGYRVEGTAWRLGAVQRPDQRRRLSARPLRAGYPGRLLSQVGGAVARRAVVVGRRRLGGDRSGARAAAGRFSLCHGAALCYPRGRRSYLRRAGIPARPQHRTALLALGIEPGLVVFTGRPSGVAGWPVRRRSLASVDVRSVGGPGLGCAATDSCERTCRTRSAEEADRHRCPAFQHRALRKERRSPRAA